MWNCGGKVMKDIIQLFIILWRERHNTNCRQKYRRTAREMEKSKNNLWIILK